MLFRLVYLKHMYIPLSTSKKNAHKQIKQQYAVNSCCLLSLPTLNSSYLEVKLHGFRSLYKAANTTRPTGALFRVLGRILA